MRAAVDAARGVSPSTKVIAVTMLTSLSDEDLPSVGLVPPVADQVLRLASLAQQCGLDGVVCSAHEIVRLRHELGPDFLLVVPGIRPVGTAVGDQRRVMGPAEACQAGADILVIGRPITAAPDPELAARDIAQSLGVPAA
jgi:orotidine-5'-phosphate decarboxylase